jgi:hypothetical protein
MERACAMQLAFQQSGAEFYPIDQRVVGAAYDRVRNRATAGEGGNAAVPEWQALLRKLDRIDPSYRQ